MVYTARDIETELRRLAALPEGAATDRLRRQAVLLFTLEDEERQALLSATAGLANSVPKMGPQLAFEVVGAVALATAKNGNGQHAPEPAGGAAAAGRA